jgi:hypothetical protein
VTEKVTITYKHEGTSLFLGFKDQLERTMACREYTLVSTGYNYKTHTKEVVFEKENK